MDDFPQRSCGYFFEGYTSRTLQEEIGRPPKEAAVNGSPRCWRRLDEIMGITSIGNCGNSTIIPMELATNKIMDQKLDYLHVNPVAAGYVNEPEHWRFSSAIDYAGGLGLLEVHFLE